MELSRIDPAFAWLKEHWPDFRSHPWAEEWMIRLVQTVAALAMVTVCIVVVVGIIMWVSVWFILSLLELISGR